MGTLEAYQQLMTALDAVRKHWRARQIMQGALAALAIAVGLVLGGVLLDHWFRPATVGRALLSMAVFGGIILAVLRLIITPWLDDRRDDFFAALVEERYPELRNRLINALQLGRGDQRGHSPELIAAIVRDAATVSDDLEMERSIDGRPLKRRAWWLLGVIGLFIGYALLTGPRFGNGLMRVLLPWADIPAYTNTRIVEVQPGDSRVPEGDSFVITAKLDGVIAVTASLQRETAAGWQTIPMQADADEPHIVRVPITNVSESFDYRVIAGDGQSVLHRIEVVARPRIERIQVRITPPPYTARLASESTGSSGEVAGVIGSTVMLTIQTNKPLRQAEMVLRDGRILRFEPTGDRRTQQVSFVLWNTAEGKNPARFNLPLVEVPTLYQVRLLDDDGITNFVEDEGRKLDPLWYPVQRLRDVSPTTIISVPHADGRPRPNVDRRVLTNEKVSLTIEARDDFGVSSAMVWLQVNDTPPQAIHSFTALDPREPQPAPIPFVLDLAPLKLKGGERVLYWSTVSDHNDITGPGRGESRKYALAVFAPDQVVGNLKTGIGNYIIVLEELIRLQTEVRTQAALAKPHDDLPDAQPAKLFPRLVEREQRIRTLTVELARNMERDPLRIQTIIEQLDGLHQGKMADVVKRLEQARDSAAANAIRFRDESLPIQDAIIDELKALLARLQKNEQAKKELTRLAKTDQAMHKQLTMTLADVLKKIDQHIADSTELMGKFEALPKKPVNELKEEKLDALRELDEFSKRTKRWTKDSVNEMTKLGTGFVDDFSLRKDVNRVYEEVEGKARQKAADLDVALEDMGVGLATRMKEDLELWLADMADNVRWRQEEMLQQKPLNVPEMPLPKALEDLIGDLLQKAEEFDEDADDVTSAWADNLDQAGWGVSDGPISTFSAKGKTGNDQPNNQEVTGRSGDGRRGKSSGQMVGDTSRALPGRKTPARVGNERYEPGQLKQEGQQDPNGATGGGKKAGAGRVGLQGGTPPDITKDIGRLNAKQAGLRERMEQVAKKLDESGVSSSRLREAIELMKSMDTDMRDRKYDDAARKRQEMLQKLRNAYADTDPTREQLSRARDLPAELRKEMLQSSDEGVPAGYEKLMKNYLKALSDR